MYIRKKMFINMDKNKYSKDVSTLDDENCSPTDQHFWGWILNSCQPELSKSVKYLVNKNSLNMY